MKDRNSECGYRFEMLTIHLPSPSNNFMLRALCSHFIYISLFKSKVQQFLLDKWQQLLSLFFRFFKLERQTEVRRQNSISKLDCSFAYMKQACVCVCVCVCERDKTQREGDIKQSEMLTKNENWSTVILCTRNLITAKVNKQKHCAL